MRSVANPPPRSGGRPPEGWWRGRSARALRTFARRFGQIEFPEARGGGRPRHRLGSPSTAARRIVAPVALLGLAASLAGCLSSGPEPITQTTPSVVERLDPAEVQARISAYRRAHDLGPVTIDPGLMALAQSQANAMAGANHLSHEIAGSLDRRLDLAHHPKGYAVENVSAGYADADAALGGWQRSPGHNANLLDRKMRRMGIAAADAPGTRFKTYWALMMTD